MSLYGFVVYLGMLSRVFVTVFPQQVMTIHLLMLELIVYFPVLVFWDQRSESTLGHKTLYELTLLVYCSNMRDTQTSSYT